MMGYTPKNWYWIVGGSTTQVYSSAARAYVSIADSAYAAWVAAGGIPTKIDTDNNLRVVLFSAGVLSINLISTATPSLDGNYLVTPDAQTSINGIVTYILSNNRFPAGLSAMPWIDADGNVRSFPDVTTFKNFATAFADFLTAVLLYIASGEGTIPTSAITIP